MPESSDWIKVEIFGATYTLHGGEHPSAVRALAAEVDARMQEIAGRASGADPLKVAVLASLRLVDELRDIRRTGGERDGRLGEELAGLATRLETLLEPSGNAEAAARA
jgi:cell division protein ZapA (FtsZ GTPase activity inhibitor)